jgi:predicted AlkP superfamily pyrophosphatase or phosphodiesterase
MRRFGRSGPSSRTVLRWVLSAAVLTACARTTAPTAAPPNDPSAPPTDPTTPRLVVLLVIDQLPTWSFDPQAHLLQGGLRRLLDEGTYFPNAAFPYAVTMTAPGHAALGTGAPPAVSGIMANQWYDLEQKRLVGAVEDPDAPVFVVEPPGLAARGVSSRNLLVDGLADALREASEGAGRSIAVGLKDRAAVLMLGRRPDLAVWYEPEQLAMTTSRAYAERLPPWLASLARTELVARQLALVWEPLDAELLAEATGVGDLDWGGGDAFGLGNTFPYVLADAPDPGRALAATPAGNTIVLETARAAIEAEDLGADEHPDLLGIAFSSHDYAGHLWGQESWERLDMLLRIDRELEDFLAFLDARVGAGHWALVVTSDHGATPLPERSDRPQGVPGRLHHAAVRRAVEDAMGEILGPGPWVETIQASTIYLSPRFREASDAQRSAAMQGAVESIRRVPGVGYADARSALLGRCGDRLDLAALVCRSLHPERSGDIYFTAAPGSYASESSQTGTSHGSPADHDRVVPIIVYGEGWPAERREEAIDVLQVAPTLAGMLGIEPPAEARTLPLAPASPGS